MLDNPLLIFIILIIVSVILAAIGSYLKSPKYKGRKGEERAHKILMTLSDGYTILDDVILATNRGSTQIDHIVVSKYGVFVIEVKNYRGDIYGNDNREEWTQLIVTPVTYSSSSKTYTYVTKNKFYNPVKQAVGHAYAVQKQLTEWSHLIVVPIVVFVGEAVLKNVQTTYHVVYEKELLDTIRTYTTIYLKDEEVQRVVERLSLRNSRELITERMHVANVNKTKREKEQLISSGICPQCGGTLVERHGKYGRFYGCSNYPNCKYTNY